MKNFYILDGKNVGEEEIAYTHLKRGFFYGDGVFETLRATENRIFMWDEHIKKLKNSAAVCGLRLSEDMSVVRGSIEKLLRDNKIECAYIRVNLWRAAPDTFDSSGEDKSHFLVVVRTYHPYPEKFYKEGVKCIVSKKYFKNEKSPLSYIKSLNYLENILARAEAKNSRCNDAILLNTAGYITSATVSNIFFVKEGNIYTPSVNCGIREGITRKLVFRICTGSGIRVKEGKFTVEDLKTADEIFLANTLMCVLPVREVKDVFKGKDFILSGFLRKKIDKKVTG